MPRPRLWSVAIVTALVLTPTTACTSGDLTAASTCADYLSRPADTRHAAAARLATDQHAYDAGASTWGTALDAGCGSAPDTTLREYFAGQLAIQAPSVSMEHTIDSGETVLVNTLAYTSAAPHRGEIIVFKAPLTWSTTPGERFVKRVIGIGGDHIACCDAQQRLLVNGHPLDEPYIYRDSNGRSDPTSTDAFDISVPAGRLWVMGDHRSRSGDSLLQFINQHDIDDATIPLKALVGKVFAVINAAHELRWLAVPPSYVDIPDPHRT